MEKVILLQINTNENSVHVILDFHIKSKYYAKLIYLQHEVIVKSICNKSALCCQKIHTTIKF